MTISFFLSFCFVLLLSLLLCCHVVLRVFFCVCFAVCHCFDGGMLNLRY